MKINPINQGDVISRVTNTNGNPLSGAQVSLDISDTVELSDGARKYADMVRSAKAAMEASEAEEEARAANIASRVTNKTYQVSDEDVVGTILGGIPSPV